MKCFLAIAVLLFLLAFEVAAAANERPSYVDLADGPSITVDWSKGATQAVTLHGNRAFIFINGQKGGKYTLIIRQDDTGSRVPAWPASVHWPGTYPPILTTTANKKDYINFFCDGVTYDLLALSQGY
jgi:hypothetical protein